MEAKHWTLLTVIVYIVLWQITSRLLNRDEKDDKMKSLWFMVSMAWPLIWIGEAYLFFRDLFNKHSRR